jgi:hypothetical protein
MHQENMTKNEILLTVFLYALVIFISVSMQSFGKQIGSLSWVKTLEVQLQEPVPPEGAPVRMTPILVMTKPVPRAGIAQTRIQPPRKVPASPPRGITTVKKISTQSENTKG